MRKYILAIILTLALPFAHGLLQPPTPVDASGDVVLAGGSCTNANHTVTLTDGSAAVACVGVDFSPFIGEWLEWYDSTKRPIKGYIGSSDGKIYTTSTYATQNWQWKHGSYDNNDASGYVYRIIQAKTPNTALLRGTCTGTTQCRFSLVDGTAFIDGDGTVPVANYVGHTLKVRDSSGYEISGVIKAKGSGETFDSNIAPNSTFENTTGVSKSAGSLASIAGGESGNCLEHTFTVSSYLYESPAFTAGSLIKSSIYMKLGTSTHTAKQFLLISSTIATLRRSVTATATSDWVQTSLYAVPLASNDVILFGDLGYSTPGTALYDTLLVTKVLTPSSTGSTIVSATGGTTYNWTSKNANFNPNQATAYTWEILGQSQGTMTSSNVRLATVDAGAMIEISGTDLSAYAGGDDNASLPCRWINPHSTTAATWKTNRYLLALYDSAGKVATGYMGFPGSGEALGAEIATGTLTVKNLYKITATEVNHFGTGLEVGEYFTSAGTETCDANNKVKQVTDIGITGVRLHQTPNGYNRTLARLDSGFLPNGIVKFNIYKVGTSGFDLDVILDSTGYPIISNPYSSVYIQNSP